MEIRIVRKSKLRNEEHFQYGTEFKDLIIKSTPAMLGIVTEYAAYEPLHIGEGVALDVIIKSGFTIVIEDADLKRNTTFRGVKGAVKSAAKHFSTEKKQAAGRVQLVFDHYGNVTKKSHNEETAAINSLITDLNNDHAADVATLGIADWLTELKANNDAFDALMKSRYTEEANKTQLRMKQIRMEVDKAYDTIVNRINALIIVNGARAYTAFVNELNERVDKYNLIVAQREGRNSKGDDPEKPKE
jgi:hypothetical protein